MFRKLRAKRFDSTNKRTPDKKTFYRSFWWKYTKKKVFKRDGNACLNCGGEKYLTCHHKTYERFGGQERMDDLETLCFTCHRRLHINLQKNKIYLRTPVGRRHIKSILRNHRMVKYINPLTKSIRARIRSKTK